MDFQQFRFPWEVGLSKKIACPIGFGAKCGSVGPRPVSGRLFVRFWDVFVIVVVSFQAQIGDCAS
jgi:hypothetical protein